MDSLHCIFSPDYSLSGFFACCSKTFDDKQQFNHLSIFSQSKSTYMVNYKELIRINPEKRFGRPCVRDTRISVYDVLAWLSKGMTKADIIEDFPELTEEDINACLAYAAEREHNLRVA
ncbi:DUF433 domain-containing protein [Telluribacter sp.]|jgi:uncharacterized protein (DUF433 family)|uniref:DUF433 domain-containing protein n=1 Tax=Telluribacter sp. TaxID=1978767 RepID=UPI002E127FAD|nr:DUF433 domain-containing protein [Telluribacter sp.]